MPKVPVLRRVRFIFALRRIFPKNSRPREFMKKWAQEMQDAYKGRLGRAKKKKDAERRKGSQIR